MKFRVLMLRFYTSHELHITYCLKIVKDQDTQSTPRQKMNFIDRFSLSALDSSILCVLAMLFLNAIIMQFFL